MVILKINNLNKFFDSETKEELKKYSATNKNLIFRFKDYKTKDMVIIPADKIKIKYGGSISFEYNNENYIIDDGYRDILAKAGYLVLDNYDIMRFPDQELGNEMKKILLKLIRSYYPDSAIIKFVENSTVEVMAESKNFFYTIKFWSVQNLVNINEQRMENKLPCYPFDKNMDKYCTIFVAIFAKKKDDASEITAISKELETKTIVKQIQSFIDDSLIDHTIKFVNLNNKKRIINIEE